MYKVSVNSQVFEGQKIEDVFLYYKVSKKVVNSLFSNKRIFINDIYANKDEIINGNESVYFVDDEINLIPYNFKINILFENNYILIVNKPANILIHSDGTTYETLQNAVYNYLIKTKQNKFCQAVHRLDYETTGIVIFAKNSLALSYLSYKFEHGEIFKQYVCLVRGKINPKEGTINLPISKDRHSNKQIVYKKGKPAITYYKTTNYNNGISKLSIKIINGRKHQIRVHLSSIGYAIIGDKVYANDNSTSLKLHCKKVEFVEPENLKNICIECNETF